MDYDFLLGVMRAALVPGSQQLAYARKVAEQWLTAQPGHLTMSVLLAEACYAAGDLPEATRVLDQVLGRDPENQPSLELKVKIHERDGRSELAWAAATTLQQVNPTSRSAQSRLGRIALKSPKGGIGQSDMAVEALSLVPALHELADLWRGGEIAEAKDLAERLLASHPGLIKAHLILSDCLLALGDEPNAVEHIHQAASLDPGAEVAHRLWDAKPPYISAWPARTIPGSPGPLPSKIAGALGLNLLPAPVREAPSPEEPPQPGKAQSSRTDEWVSPVQETLLTIQTELNRLGHRTSKSRKTGKQNWVRLRPVYVILTSKTRLTEKYGEDGWEQINGALGALAGAAEARLGLPTGVVYVDDRASLSPFELQPVDPQDPWAIKTLVNQLDIHLNADEQEIGWLLIVGGADIIPFHRLPNPADDGDPDVPSDNPYGCRDGNFYVPERAVGRMPDGAGGTPRTLLNAISTALAAQNAQRRSNRRGLLGWLMRLISLFRLQRLDSELSYGYSASVWRKASLSVFSRIGTARRLRISPPLTASEFSGLSLGPTRYAYFNLHGVADGPNWYGQRDPTFPADYPAFPVALRPQDIEAIGCVPEVVVSEACYGGLADNKTPETALCLRFLSSGTQMFVGSTCVAYGGLNSTPEAADQLAAFFWQELLNGRAGGVALQQAKVAFAQYLQKRQGYLDAEDQKTLLSFVYYGDPSLTALPQSREPQRAKRTWKSLTSHPSVACAQGGECSLPKPVSEKIVKEVRAKVAGYLPGMEQARLTVSQQQGCKGGSCDHPCQNCHQGASHSGQSKALPSNLIFTLEKTVDVAGTSHQQIVRVTVDDSGAAAGQRSQGVRVLKLTVSK